MTAPIRNAPIGKLKNYKPFVLQMRYKPFSARRLVSKFKTIQRVTATIIFAKTVPHVENRRNKTFYKKNLNSGHKHAVCKL